MKLKDLLGLPPMRLLIGMMAIAITGLVTAIVNLSSKLSTCQNEKVTITVSSGKQLNDYLMQRLEKFEKLERGVDTVIKENNVIIQDLSEKVQNNKK